MHINNMLKYKTIQNRDKISHIQDSCPTATPIGSSLMSFSTDTGRKQPRNDSAPFYKILADFKLSSADRTFVPSKSRKGPCNRPDSSHHLPPCRRLSDESLKSFSIPPDKVKRGRRRQTGFPRPVSILTRKQFPRIALASRKGRAITSLDLFRNASQAITSPYNEYSNATRHI